MATRDPSPVAILAHSPRITGADFNIRPDDRDAEILAQSVAARETRPGPRVGDVVQFIDGTRGRFTHRWHDGLQTTVRGGKFGDGSFYLGRDYTSYSGALDPSIPLARIEPTDEIELRRVWFFHHGYMCAHSAVYAEIPCRVYREKAQP